MDLNQIQLIGNVTADVEVKETKAGTKYCSFSVATNYSYKTADGEKHDEATYHECTAWGNRAEVIAKLAKKGKKVFVQGRLTKSKVEQEDGRFTYFAKVHVEHFIMLSKSEKYGVDEEQIDRIANAKPPSYKGLDPEIDIEEVPF
jgi:single-strand DNA-binding protein